MTRTRGESVRKARKRAYRIVQDKEDPVVKRQRGALYVVIIAVVLDVLCGFGFSYWQHVPVWAGLYWAEGEATTVGSRFVATTPWAEFDKAIVGLTVVPLFAATFSIFTTALTAVHVHKAEGNLKAHVTHEKEAIKRHISGGKENG